MKATTIARLAGAGAISTLALLAPAVSAGAAPYPNGGDTDVAPVTQVSGATAQASGTGAAKASTLPFTGGDIAQIAVLGAASVGAGAFVVRRSRRRAG
jgi:hypothetical protein